ncbi:MAG: hypothetical protein HYX48_06700 [Chlamydiales bacterium]|nr:hypothetical protein [Chlamydiales bacterium]
MTNALTLGIPIRFQTLDEDEELDWGMTILQEADAFFSIFSDKVAVVDTTKITDGFWPIKIEDAEPFEWSVSTVLKVAFCFTLVIPLIVFIVKLAMRTHYEDSFILLSGSAKGEQKHSQPKKVTIDRDFDWRSLPSVAALDLRTPVTSTYTGKVFENGRAELKQFTSRVILEEVFDYSIRYLKSEYNRNDDDQGGTFTFDDLRLANMGCNFRYAIHAKGSDGRNFAEIVFDTLISEGCIVKYEKDSQYDQYTVWDHKSQNNNNESIT